MECAEKVDFKRKVQRKWGFSWTSTEKVEISFEKCRESTDTIRQEQRD